MAYQLIRTFIRYSHLAQHMKFPHFSVLSIVLGGINASGELFHTGRKGRCKKAPEDRRSLHSPIPLRRQMPLDLPGWSLIRIQHMVNPDIFVIIPWALRFPQHLLQELEGP